VVVKIASGALAAALARSNYRAPGRDVNQPSELYFQPPHAILPTEGKPSSASVGCKQNNCLTLLNSIARPKRAARNALGDLPVLPDLMARYRAEHTGRSTPFDSVSGNFASVLGRCLDVVRSQCNFLARSG
jgi:hypothetical protein